MERFRNSRALGNGFDPANAANFIDFKNNTAILSISERVFSRIFGNLGLRLWCYTRFIFGKSSHEELHVNNLRLEIGVKTFGTINDFACGTLRSKQSFGT